MSDRQPQAGRSYTNPATGKTVQPDDSREPFRYAAVREPGHHRLVVEVNISPGYIDATYIENGAPIHGAGDSTGTLPTASILRECVNRLQQAASLRRIGP